jgi:beta-aspartyl-peptidase (threonine type)
VSAADIMFAMHGGAGAMPRAEMTPEREAAIRADLTLALQTGQRILLQGGPAIDAVGAAVVVLEDSPRFNAGKGAVLNANGVAELDASIMDGATLKAGAVAGLHHVKNPIKLARAVMDHSPHVMLIGDGAEAFAKTVGIELVEPKYFYTKQRWDELQKAKAKARAEPHAALPAKAYFGTVGAVALDRQGHLAAATSTGGMTNKRWGRVGDSPIIGAGTYANAQCAVSATGWGEFYIRAAAAHDICARVEYRGDAIAAAVDAVVMKKIPALGGDGGVIAMDRDGHVAFGFNTEGMYRGTIDNDGNVKIDIYR